MEALSFAAVFWGTQGDLSAGPSLCAYRSQQGSCWNLQLCYSSLWDFKVSLLKVWVKAKCHASAGFKLYVISASIMQGLLKWIPRSWWGNFCLPRGGKAVLPRTWGQTWGRTWGHLPQSGCEPSRVGATEDAPVFLQHLMPGGGLGHMRIHVLTITSPALSALSRPSLFLCVLKLNLHALRLVWALNGCKA